MSKLPLARTAEIVVHQVDKELLLYDLRINKAFCLNETSALVWQLCDGQSSLADISKAVGKKLSAPSNEGLVWLALEQLKKEKLIENEVTAPTGFEGLSRREVIRQVGFASMVAIPVVASVIAPTAAAAQSCLGIGQNAGPANSPGLCSATSPGTRNMDCTTDAGPNCCSGIAFYDEMGCLNTPTATYGCFCTEGF